MSFELAAKRLSADGVNMSGAASSTVKGETLIDTVRNVDAMRPDAMVVRTPGRGTPGLVAKHIRASVVNAGDGAHEHPTQALLDASTIRAAKGRVKGLVIAICGDINHSRVARSNILALTKLGANVRIAGPRTMLPRHVDGMGVEAFDRLEPAIEGADVVMMLRIQKGETPVALIPSLREYSRVFGLNIERLSRADPTPS